MANNERVQLLIDALRFGEFIQGTGSLEYFDNDDGKTKNCCLGVACRVAQRNGLEMTTSVDKGVSGLLFNKVRFFCEGYEDTNLLPRPVWEWFGFDSSDPELVPLNDDVDSIHDTVATELNDDVGYNFNQIADAFERTYME